MAATARGLALTDQYRARLAQTRNLTVARVGSLWAATMAVDGSLDDRFDTFATRAIPTVEVGQARTRTLTAGYLAAYLTTETGQRVAPPPIRPVTDLDLRGVPTSDVYRRAVTTTRVALAEGADPATALERGAARIRQTASTDLQLAQRDAAAAFADTPDTPNVDRWVRVVGASCCAVCASLDGQIVSSPSIMPIHSACTCTVEPLPSGERRQIERPAPQIVDSPALAKEADTGDLPVAIHQHGELGPVAYPAGQSFAS